jgi:hypothetical protein
LIGNQPSSLNTGDTWSYLPTFPGIL